MLSENYNYERIRLGKKACDDSESTFRQYDIEIADFSRLKSILTRLVAHFIGFLITILFFQNVTFIVISQCISIVLFYILLNAKVFKETLIFIPSVGFQDTVYYLSGRTETSFYEHSKVRSLIINESVSVFKCMFYLCLVCDKTGEESLRPLLVGIKPKLEILKLIYTEINELM